MQTLLIRNLLPADFEQISAVIDDWWGGRPMRAMIPRLFFEHFNPTSFAIGEPGQVIGFLIGFISQSQRDVAYIHFVGVHPGRRGEGLGRKLYEALFRVATEQGCSSIECITSPLNTGSIEFHLSMGFTLLTGSGQLHGVPVFLDHAAPGEHRVRFRKSLGVSDSDRSPQTK
jgi:GNAT superfamily N-acetyltransferase